LLPMNPATPVISQVRGDALRLSCNDAYPEDAVITS
jgi:hypothetical protein